MNKIYHNPDYPPFTICTNGIKHTTSITWIRPLKHEMKPDLWTTIHCNSYGSSSRFGLISLFVYRNPTLVKKGIPRSWAQLLASNLMSFVWFLKAYIKNQTVIYLSSEGIPETPSYHKPITPRFAHLTFCPLLNTGSDT